MEDKQFFSGGNHLGRLLERFTTGFSKDIITDLRGTLGYIFTNPVKSIFYLLKLR